MKKLILVIAIYTAIIFGLCILLSFLFVALPNLLPGDKNFFLFLQGTRFFLACLPGIFLSGFVVACALIWQKKSGNSRVRFSPAMFDRYRFVLISSLFFVFILFFCQEILGLSAERKIERMKNAPDEYSEYIAQARDFLRKEEPSLAVMAAKKAVKVSPHDKIASALLAQAENEVEIANAKRFYGRSETKEERIEKPIRERDTSYTILELLEKSDKAASDRHWFNAHYWASLALEACDGTNTNLAKASEKANYAWKMLSLPAEFDNSVEKNYYSIKKEGYISYLNGDDLKAYYIFTGLKNDYPSSANDPDVIRFLSLSRENVENQYFFFDETQFIDELADSRKIHFSVYEQDGTKDVLYIGKSMDKRKDGGLVRYLKDFYVVHYDEDNNFCYSFYVPFAKAVAQPVSTFGEKNLSSLGIEKSWKYVPVITLQSIDRNTEGLVSRPIFSFEISGLPREIIRSENLKFADEKPRSIKQSEIKNSSAMILAMPFSDFHLIKEASDGANKMTLLALNKFMPLASEYGFSKEVFTQSFVQRGTFPFILLFLFVFCACIGWNYRVDNPRMVFKFKWILLIPLFGFVMVVAYNIALYFFNMLNYVFVGFFGTGSIIVAFVLYVLLFFFASLTFLSRKT